MTNPAIIAPFTTTTNGAVPAPGVVQGYSLRDDATWGPGVTGPKGATGPTGITAVGPTGPAGVAGVAGAPGSAGTVGATGPTGQGLVGPTGATGAKGAAGSAGAVGPVGSTGPQGIQGPAGSGSGGAAFEFNVKDYGALGDGSDQTTAIQNTVNACMAAGGGIVKFPTGLFRVGNASTVGKVAAISFNGQSTAGIRVIGSGLSSIIQCFVNNQYIFDIAYGPNDNGINQPVKSFEYLNLQCSGNNASTYVITDTEHCAGCIHVSGGIGTPQIIYCEIGVYGGIGVFSNAQNVMLIGTNVSGQYAGTNSSGSIGVFSSSVHVADCKINGLGFGVIACASGPAAFSASGTIDIELCGTPVCVGYSPIKFLQILDVGDGTVSPTGVAPLMNPGYYKANNCQVSNISCESCGSSDQSDVGTFYINANTFHLDTLVVANYGQRGDAQCALDIGDLGSGTISNCRFSASGTGKFLQAGIQLGNPDGVHFKNTVVENTNGGGQGWKWKTTTPTWQDGAGEYKLRGASFEACNWDGALHINYLPLHPAIGFTGVTVSNFTMTVDDSLVDPTGNIGVAVSATAIATAAKTTGATTLQFAPGTGIPPQVAAGWKVFSLRQNILSAFPSTVVGTPNYAAGTLVVANGVASFGPGVAVGEVFMFTNGGGGSRKNLVRFGPDAAWRIAG